MSAIVGKAIDKIDGQALVTGKPVYTEDLEPSDALVVKLLRSPHAHALIMAVHREKAMKVPGIEAIYTYEDVPKNRFTLAGQSFPEPSPYDRLILDQRVRYAGDEVCIVAGTSEAAVDRALKLIKVDYDVLPPLLDYEEAKNSPIVIHPEEDYHVNYDIGNDVNRNVCASGSMSHGDLDSAVAGSDLVVEHVYRTKANNQGMMEPFKTFTTLDPYGRLTVVSSTQVPFHVRRHLAKALDISPSKIKVVKPRIGGGFGAKQTVVSEIFPAFVTMKTGKAAKLYYTRKEVLTASTSRHAMTIRIKVAGKKDGTIQGIHVNTLSNTGAYGEHGPTTVGLTATKTISLYNKVEAFRFDYEVVYTNTMSAGAFRGYGATQGAFALESAINEFAHKIGMDPLALRLKNLVSVGEAMPSYYNETLYSCHLKECMEKGRKMIGWDEHYPSYKLPNGKIRAFGMAISMQGSGISAIDIASVRLHLDDNGAYTLMIGATDMGTGCDTILAQMAAEGMKCHLSDIIVHGVDTDVSPYDTGSYASSTTYVTGGALVKACMAMNEMIVEEAAAIWDVPVEKVTFDGTLIQGPDQTMTRQALAQQLAVGDHRQLIASGSNSKPVSPPPFMAGFVEIEADPDTLAYEVVNYVAVVDCGTVINPNLARIQVEGGIAQGIGMAMSEDIAYSAKGRMYRDSLMLYRMPSRQDVGRIQVAFDSSYEPTGPYGAKSIGEIVINTPSPAIAHAVNNAFGTWVRTLPITPQRIFETLNSDGDAISDEKVRLFV